MILAASLVVIAAMLVVLTRARAQYLAFSEISAAPASKAPEDVTVVVPARNAAATVAATVQSLVNQAAAVIVVDDESSDGTGAAAKAAGAHVIGAPPLKHGVAGKANACAAGAAFAETHWILFADANTQFKDGFLTSLVAEARRRSLDVAPVLLRERRRSFWEAIILPYATALTFTGINAAKVNAKKSFDALSSSACMLFRREFYEFIGGHNAVKTSIIEDSMLAFVGKRHRVNQTVLRAERLGQVTHRNGFGGVWRWIQRSSFRFALVSRWCGPAVVASALLLSLYLPLIGLLVWTGQLYLAGVLALIPTVLLWPWYGGIGAIVAPIAIYAFDVIAVFALIATALGRMDKELGVRR